MPNEPMKISSRPRYSFVIPVRNGYEYLAYNLRPLIESRRQDFEVIILFNDLAAENQKLNEILKNDTRFRVHHNEIELRMRKGAGTTVKGTMAQKMTRLSF